VLPGVLLHVIEASGPVDAAIHVRIRGVSVNDVKDLFAFVAHIQNIRVADFPQIMWLPAGSGIESGAVEEQAPGGSRNPTLYIRRKHVAMHNARGKLL